MHLGNDAANVLAEHVSGSIPNFVDLMNSKAKEIGCYNTNFVNPNGLPAEGHYSCAYDLAIMYKYAYDNFEAFRTIVNETSGSLPTSDKHSKDDRTFTNSNRLIMPDSEFYYAKCNGGKTGYTTEAKNCLVSSAISGDIVLICTVLGGENDATNKSYRYNDSINLFEYGFSKLYKATIINAGTIVQKESVKNAPFDDNELAIVTDEPLYAILNYEHSAQDFTSNINISGEIVAPIFKDQKVGTLQYTIYGKEYSVDLVASKDILERVESPAGLVISNIIMFIFRTIVIGALLVIIIRVINIYVLKNNSNKRLLNMKKYNARFRR